MIFEILSSTARLFPKEDIMSDPTDATPEAPTPPTYEEQVNDALSKFADDGTGKMVLPAELNLDEGLRYSVMAEKRRRDTESALSKAKSSLTSATAERDALQKRATATVPLVLSAEKAAELAELQLTDPEAWRQEVNAMETAASSALSEELTTLSTNAAQAAEQTRRIGVLAEFNLQHPGAEVTDATLASDIPPRISNKLKDGKISFEEFLTEASDYISKGKTTARATPSTEPNLGDAGGNSSGEPGSAALPSYEDSTF